jgi:hypothetical protein
MDAARLPEVFDFDDLTVRAFPGAYATEFSSLPQSKRRATPAIVRRLFSSAAKHAKEDANCLICSASVPLEGRMLIAVETAAGHDIGCVCAACAGEASAISAPVGPVSCRQS